MVANTSAVKVAGIYFLFSMIWIIVTDYLLMVWIDDIGDFHLYSSGKGLIFIAVSASLIYFLIRHELLKLHAARENITLLETHDPLTGLFNRSQYEQSLKALDKRQVPYGLILFDINGLRLINELYDYDTGNALLRDVAGRIANAIPASAFLARSGGDAFAVLLEDVDADEVKQLAETLQASFNQIQLGKLQSTMALGYAFNATQKPSRDVVAEAEKALSQSKLADSTSSSNAVINSIKTALYERSDETEQHAQRMQRLARAFGQRLDLPYTALNDLEMLTMLHDIGKIGIDDAVLKKPGRLTDAEYEMMKQHTTIGYKMATTIQEIEHIAYFILTHHEWYDGRGYPKGLKGEAIPLLSRVLAIIDAYDVMTHDRVYKKAVTKLEAIAELRRCQGTQFDPALIDTFIDMISNQTYD
ncbi:MAG: diguanylate cyclase [Acholeplasmatales bacterium]|nr:MAG: diguanylate cyclase [Acholeplasmatales bacterium]